MQLPLLPTPLFLSLLATVNKKQQQNQLREERECERM